MAPARQPTGTAQLDDALAAIVDRAAQIAGADVVVVRLADEQGGLVAHAVHAVSESARAELESSRIELDALADEAPAVTELPPPLRLAAERLSAVGVLQLPVRENGDIVGSIELMRRRSAFDERQVGLARAIADEVALARRAYALEGAARLAPDPLELAGDALAAAADETQAAEQVAVSRRRGHGSAGRPDLALRRRRRGARSIRRAGSRGARSEGLVLCAPRQDVAGAGHGRAARGGRGRRDAAAGRAPAGRPPARARQRARARRPDAVAAGDVRGPGGPHASRRRAAPLRRGRARAEPRAPDDRRAGNLRALPGAHARHRSRPRLRAALGRSPRRLPARGRPSRDGRRLRPHGPARPDRRMAARSRTRTGARPGPRARARRAPRPGSARSAAPSRSSGSRPCSAFPCAQVTS